MTQSGSGDVSGSTDHQRHHASERHEHDHSFADPERIARLRDEAELLAPMTMTAIDRLRGLLGATAPSVIVDIGSGPGVGTCALAQSFPTAGVTAVDSAAATLDAVRERARRLGIGERVSSAQLELPAGVATLPQADVIWASMALHHVGDEVGLMRELVNRIRPGGYLCVIEWDQPPHPIDLDTADASGVQQRLHQAWKAWFAQMRSGLPGWVPSRPYPDMMAEAGYSVVVSDTLSQTFVPPLSTAERVFAGRWLAGTVERLQPFANASDLNAIAALIEHRAGDTNPPMVISNVGLATSRTLTIAQRRTDHPSTCDVATP